MIRRTIRGALGCLGLLVVLFVTFFVPLGKRTLYQHLARIAETDEAKELGEEATQAGERLTDEVSERIRQQLDGGGEQ